MSVIKKKPEETSKSLWRDLITDVMLIDEVQTYGMHQHANKIALISCRCILIALGIYFTYYIGCTQGEKYYGLFAFTAVIIVETIFLCVKRNGIDFGWFSVSYLAYSLQFVAGLWVGSGWSHELEDLECKTNVTLSAYTQLLSNCKIPHLSSYCTSITIFVCVWLMSMIFVRRHSPIEIENETHSLLLIDYLTAAADIVDFADYSNNETITHKVGINLIWALVMISSIQFSVILSASIKIKEISKGNNLIEHFFFGTEVWSIVLVLITIEWPYAIAIKFGILNDSTVFFLSKNILMSAESIRRILIIYFDFKNTTKVSCSTESETK